jgi:hypothetical protein
MKKLLGIIVLGLLWCNVGFSGTSGDLTTSWNYDSSWGKLTISAYNANSSKTLTVTKMKIWFGGCAGTDSRNPDRIFNVNKLVRPYSQREITMYVDLPKGRKCASISHKTNQPVVYKAPKIKKCSETNYESPCTCEKEPNFIKKNYCKLRKKQENKMTRSEAAKYCANKAEDFSKEVGAEYYKDCMKDEGF